MELIKVVKKVQLEDFRNSFLNLALPMFVLSEPGPVSKTVLRYGCFVFVFSIILLSFDATMIS